MKSFLYLDFLHTDTIFIAEILFFYFFSNLKLFFFALLICFSSAFNADLEGNRGFLKSLVNLVSCEYLTTKNLWRKRSDKFENKNNSKCIKKAAKYKGMGKSFNDSGFQFLS